MQCCRYGSPAGQEDDTEYNTHGTDRQVPLHKVQEYEIGIVIGSAYQAAVLPDELFKFILIGFLGRIQSPDPPVNRYITGILPRIFQHRIPALQLFRKLPVRGGQPVILLREMLCHLMLRLLVKEQRRGGKAVE